MSKASGANPGSPGSRQDETEWRLSVAEASVLRHLAHELGQPLSTIESIAYYLELVIPPEQTSALQQAAKLRQMVQQASCILADAVYCLQASPAAPRPVDFDALISAAVREAGAGEAAWIHVDLGAEPAMAQVDPEQGKHLVRTLLHFLRQAGKADPHISVRTSADGPTVVLELETQSEPAIREELTSAMPEPFHPLLPAGTGLSLTCAHRIANVHGGHLECSCDESGAIRLRVELPEAR
jgi:nitrogen-specific signal transduction histidine kinase